MLARYSAVALLLLTARAAAEPAASDVPGTGGDPILALGVLPDIVDAPLVPKLVRRGVDDTVFLFDGFELPHMFHDRTRSVIAGGSLADLHADDSVEYGRGVTLVELAPRPSAPTSATATLRDFEVTTPNAYARYSPFDTAYTTPYGDLIGAIQIRRDHWQYRFAAVVAKETGASARVRDVLTAEHLAGSWRSRVALSVLFDQKDDGVRESYDARASTEHVAAPAGLTRLAWQIGVDSLNGRHTVDDQVIWTPDEALWSRVVAHMSPGIIATAGVRVDAFLRGGDFATQPRASIHAAVTKRSHLTLRAGAYRRPPERPDELTASYLHPERTTALEAQFDHALGAHEQVAVTGYYTDRTHLIVRDPFGALANTGFETAQGIELTAVSVRGPWNAFLGASWSSARHHDFFRAADRPADFDQPVRINALLRYRARTWRITGRFGLSSGLPYTPVVETTYDADADRYEPVYGLPNTARLPLHHELSIRADVRLNRHFSAFLDLHNAYAAQTAVGYEYSYDYKERLAVTLPILPFVGLRGQL